MKKIYLIFIVAIIFVQYSCRKEIETKFVPITHSWSLDSGMYANNKILLTSVALNDSILAVATSYSITYMHVNNLKSTFTIFINGNDMYSTGLIRPSVNKTVTVAVGDNTDKLTIFKTYMPTYLSGMPPFFIPTYSNSATTLKGFPRPTLYNAGYPVIKSKYILAPYETDFTGKKSTLSLIKIDTSRYCEITSSKDVVLDNPAKPGFYSGTYSSWAYYDKFFVTHYGQTYRVDTLGNYKCLTDAFGGKYIQQMFTLNNYLFALGWGNLFVSTNQGESWNLFLDLNGTNYGMLQYFNVGNEVYTTYLSQLARVTLNGTTLSIVELDNDGLEGNLITSVTKCGKYAFLTTLSGLYYRDTTSLNTVKK